MQSATQLKQDCIGFEAIMLLQITVLEYYSNDLRQVALRDQDKTWNNQV